MLELLRIRDMQVYRLYQVVVMSLLPDFVALE